MLRHDARPGSGGQAVICPQAMPLGYLYTLTAPVLACLGFVFEVQVAGYQVSGWIWAAALAVGTLLLLAKKAIHKSCRSHFPAGPWLAWLGFIWLALAWADPLKGWNIQSAVQFSMPLVVGLVAALYVRSEEQLALLLRIFRGTLFLALALVVASKLMPVGPQNFGRDRALALTVCLVGCVYASLWPESKLTALMGWAGCILVSLATRSRMATFTLVLLPAVSPMVGGLGRRLLAVGSVGLLGVALLYTPVFQGRFFVEGSGTLSQVLEGKFLTQGRLEVWPLIWAEAVKHPVLGAGTGSAAAFTESVWPDVRHPHNDYLRLFFETGAAGLAVFLLVLAWQFRDLLRRIGESSGVIRQAFVASLLGFFVFAVTALTDNTLIYNLPYMDPLFAILGAAYGASGAIACAARERAWDCGTVRSPEVEWSPGNACT